MCPQCVNKGEPLFRKNHAPVQSCQQTKEKPQIRNQPGAAASGIITIFAEDKMVLSEPGRWQCLIHWSITLCYTIFETVKKLKKSILIGSILMTKMLEHSLSRFMSWAPEAISQISMLTVSAVTDLGWGLVHRHGSKAHAKIHTLAERPSRKSSTRAKVLIHVICTGLMLTPLKNSGDRQRVHQRWKAERWRLISSAEAAFRCLNRNWILDRGFRRDLNEA